MTTANYPDSDPAVAFEDDGATSTGAKDQAKQAAGTAADEGKHVAGVAQDEARKVASEAKSQVHSLLDQATSQVEEQSRTQRDRLVETLRSLGEDLEKMAAQSDGGPASSLAHDVADRARSVSSHLDGREPRELLDDVRDFARRKPGTFLLGALAAGVVAGRLTRGAKQAQQQEDSGPTSMSGASGTNGTSAIGDTSDAVTPAVPATQGTPAPRRVTGSPMDPTIRGDLA